MVVHGFAIPDVDDAATNPTDVPGCVGDVDQPVKNCKARVG